MKIVSDMYTKNKIKGQIPFHWLKLGTLQEFLGQKTSAGHPQWCEQHPDKCQDGANDMVEQLQNLYFLKEKKSLFSLHFVCYNRFRGEPRAREWEEK